MRTLVVALFATSGLVGIAHAADKPVIAPVPAWVKPAAVPALPTKTDESPVKILLSDQQVALERGTITTYSDLVALIQTPQGLALGNISLPWRPETDILTIHKLLIRRGSTVIDVLGSGQTFTVMRREQNLESATLDGVLTANIQPEGLQVGDMLELVTSIASSDPVLKGHVETTGADWNGIPVAHAHFRAQWPNTLPVRFQQSTSLPPLKPVRTGGTTTLDLSLDGVEPLVLPKGAPARYGLGRLLQVTDFASWGDLVALMAPLFEKAATLPASGALASELARIKALSSDPKVRAEAALALVQDRVRYVALAMGAGGYVPADAETTWARRYGDCKGKTALLLALLHAMDIAAEPVLVNATLHDGLDTRLPMVSAFNHVLVRATIAGRVYWLDGTRIGDTSLDAIVVPDFGWGLPLGANSTALVRMLPPPFDTPQSDTMIRIDARAGLDAPAPFKVEMLLRGDGAVSTNAGLANSVGSARDIALKKFWKGQYDFVEPTSTSATFDPKRREERLVMEGMAKMDWSSGWYETDGTRVGYKADFSREPGPDRDAPFAVAYPYYIRTSETILLPPAFATAKVPEKTEVDQVVAGIAYKRHATLQGNVFTIEKTERSVVPEFPAKDAPAAQVALRALADRTVYLQRPGGYLATDADLKVALATTPATADGLIDRGNLLLDRGRYDEAIKDFTAAIALNPKSAIALADRGIAHAWKDEFAEAAKDLDAAEALDPRDAVLWRGRGVLAERRDDPKGAIVAYNTALEIEPGNSFAIGHRAIANHAVGNDTAALADAAVALKDQPQWTDLYLLRANIFRVQKQPDAAAKEAAAAESAAPSSAYAHLVAGAIYHGLAKDVDALGAYDRALGIEPSASIYVARSRVHPASAIALRRADVEAALKLEPTDAEALYAKAELLLDTNDAPGAIAVYSTMLQQHPADHSTLLLRGIAHARAGNTALADKDFAKAREGTVQANFYNNMCWSKATAGVALESALADCNQALLLAPDTPAFLDSRAFVELRLGKLEAAIADYNRALAKQPNLAASLMGRAIAGKRMGDTAKAEADLAAAIKANPNVVRQFEKYGVRL